MKPSINQRFTKSFSLKQWLLGYAGVFWAAFVMVIVSAHVFSYFHPDVVKAVAGDLQVDVSSGGALLGTAVSFAKFADSANSAYYIDPADGTTSINVAGNVSIGLTDTVDDTIFFDGGGHSFLWDDSANEFDLSADLTINETNPALDFIDTSSGHDDFRIYADSDDLYFYDITAGATRMTIDDTGQVGIGTTTPSGIFEVLTNDSTNNNIVNLLTVTHLTSGTATAASKNFTVDQGNTLGNRLAAYWKLDEASGTRVDAAGPYDLTDINTVTSTTGKQGNAAVFATANSEELGSIDSGLMSIDSEQGYSLAGWIYLTSSGTQPILTKYNGSTNQLREHYLYVNSGNNFSMLMYDEEGTQCAAAVATTFGTPSLNTWYFLATWYDPKTEILSISVNNGTANTSTASCEPGGSSSKVYLGGDQIATATLAGRMDEWGIWQRPLNSQELTDLYNGGTGVTCTDDCNSPTTTTTGIGSGILFRSEDAAGNTENQARISSIFNTATNGTETSSLLFETRSAGSALARTMRLDGRGNLTTLGAMYAGGSPDIAENIRVTDQSIEAGDVVMIDPAFSNGDPSDTYNAVAVKKAATAYGTDVLGVVSTDPGFLVNARFSDSDSSKASAENERPLALAGRVPVKVSTINGPIAPGDPLTASTFPGVAMKATKPGRIIGVALESYSGTAPSQVLMYVNPGWYGPEVVMPDGVSVLAKNGSYQTFADSVQTSAKAAYETLASSTIEAGRVQVHELIVDGVDILKSLNALESRVKLLENDIRQLKKSQ